MVTPTYPGVYVQELPSGVRTIAGVATAIAAFIGYFPSGPMNKAVDVLNWAAFERVFGGLHPDSETSYAVQQFFLNGGVRAIVVRTASGDPKAAGVRLFSDSGGTGAPSLTVSAANPGAWGNEIRLSVDYDTTDSNRTFNLYVSVSRRDASGGLHPLGAEMWSNLSKDPDDLRFVETVINNERTGSDFIRVKSDSTVRPARSGTTSRRIRGLGMLGFTGFTDPAEVNVTIGEVTKPVTLAEAATPAEARTALEKGIREADLASSFTDTTVSLVGDFLRVVDGNGDTPSFAPSDAGALQTIIELGLRGLSAAKPSLDIAIGASPVYTLDIDPDAATFEQVRLSLETEIRGADPANPAFASASVRRVGNTLQIVAGPADRDGNSTDESVIKITEGDTAAATAGIDMAEAAAAAETAAQAADTAATSADSAATAAETAAAEDTTGATPVADAAGAARTAADDARTAADDARTAADNADSATEEVTAGAEARTAGEKAGIAGAQARAAGAQAEIAGASDEANAAVTAGNAASEAGVAAMTAGATTDPITWSELAFDGVDDGTDDGRAENVQRYVMGTDTTPMAGFQSSDVKGDDGSPPDGTALIGKEGDKSGIYALEDVDLFTILCIPRTAEVSGENALSGTDAAMVMGRAINYCEAKRAFFIMDTPNDISEPMDIRQWMDGQASLRSSYAALYYPRVQMPDPNDENRLRSVGASGTMAGLYSRVDSSRGIWKAPAGVGTGLNNVQATDYALTDTENGVLNPLAINCIRNLSGVGIVSWGARTLDGADSRGSEWKYVPIRRLALNIEESLYRGLTWVVFEGNDEPLWAQIRLNVGTFMHNLFRKGAFEGSSPSDAYFVKCDGDTTTAADRNLGIVNIHVGFAPLKPAEFVMLYLQQKTAESAG